MTNRRDAPPRRSPWLPWAALAIVVATCVAYGPALHAPFIFDDSITIPQNASIRRLAPSVAFHPPPNTPVSGRPVANFSLAVNYAIGAMVADEAPDRGAPPNTLAFHVGNLLLHLLSGALLLGTLRRTFRTQAYDAWWAAHADAGAATVAAVWLLHPLQTEAVDYLAQRTELLVSACYLGTLYASIRAWDAGSAFARRGWLAAALVACVLGMGSKEVMISAPIAVILWDRAFRANSWRDLVRGPRRLYYPLLLLTAGVLAGILATAPRAATAGFHVGMTWYQYLYSQGWAIPHYLRLVVWPKGLTLDYGSAPVAGVAGGLGLAALGLAGLLTLAAWARATRWGWFGFLGALFFLILGPSSSFVPIVTEIAAERRMYLALAPVLVVVVIGFEAALRRAARGNTARAGWGKLIVAFVVAICGLLSAATFQRSRLYADPVALWSGLVARSPNNPRVYDNLAVAILQRDAARGADAAALWRRAIGVDSTYVAGWYKLGVVAAADRRYDEATRDLDRALALDPGDAGALDEMGDVLAASGQPEKGIPYLEHAITVAPTDSNMIDLGNAYLEVGRVDDAERSFRSAIALDPSRTDVMGFLGALLTEHGKARDAIPVLESALERRPGVAINLALLSVAYADVGRDSDAVAAAAKAVAAAGSDERVLLFAGRAMLRSSRPADAEQYLSRAVHLAPADPDALTGLGDADAALGRRAEATAEYRRALEISPDMQTARAGLAHMRGGPGGGTPRVHS
ncbi:MAG TPA: tetratricopeptide repeat protein [Gemmatimonadaceae bacterium]|nr:tetratricopeptide repeat protein [Gemmatimonadaceae bacterium]